MATSNNSLDFRDPGMMSDELLSVPGFINELKNYTIAVSPRPNPPLAFAGALAMLAHLSGRSYIDERGTHTNLYLAALAPTAMGKDEPRTTNKYLALAAGIMESVPDTIASGEGLEDAVEMTPNLLLQTDEADSLLTAMRGGDSRASKMNEMVLRFFSETKSGHAMRLKAGEKERRIIPMPHLTLFATGIPKFVYSALSAKALENGLLGRCLFIETDEFRPLGIPEKRDLPSACVEAAKFFVTREKAFSETANPILTPVPETPEAKIKIAELRVGSDEIARRLFDSELKTGAALYCRLYEKAMKLALLYAISENPANPVISAEGVYWAARFATHITQKMLFEAQFNVSEGAFDRLKQRFLNILVKHGGKLDHSTLLKSLRIEASLFKRIVLTLLMCDQIESEELINGKRGYIIKNAA